MGKKFTPSYANIYKAEWEETGLIKCKYKPTHYHRYLDHIWGVWTYGEKEFGNFIETLNSHHKSTTVNFLDTTMYKGRSFDISGYHLLYIIF